MRFGTPKVDVILPFTAASTPLTAVTLRDRLEAIERFTEIPFRVILGDDGNDGSVVDHARAWAADHPKIPIVLFSNKQSVGLTSTVARALQEATCEFVAVVSPRVRIADPSWFGKLLAPLQRDPICSFVYVNPSAPWSTMPPVRMPPNVEGSVPFGLVLHRGKTARALGFMTGDQHDYLTAHAVASRKIGATVWQDPSVRVVFCEPDTKDRLHDRSLRKVRATTDTTVIIRR